MIVIERLKGWVGQRLAHPFFLVRVSGESMWPLLVPGRRYLASSLLAPRQGRIVVAPNPSYPPELLIKRVERVEGQRLHLGGTVGWSSSYVVPRQSVYGVLLSRRLRWLGPTRSASQPLSRRQSSN